MMASARFPDSIFCAFVCLCVCALFVRLSRVRGFRWLCLFVSVYVCNIPPVCVGIVRLHICTRIYIYVSIYIDASWPVIIPFTRIMQLYFCSFRDYFSSLISA